MLGQMELPYLVFSEHETSGDCRFCHDRTRDAVYPPELKDEIHSPVFVCAACREVTWKVEELRKALGRSVVETIIHKSELPVIPQELQLNVASLSPRWMTGSEASRVFVYFHEGRTRMLSTKYDERIRAYQDITDKYPHLKLTIPELDRTVLEGSMFGPNIAIADCLRFRGLDIRDIKKSVRFKAIDKVMEIIGDLAQWTRFGETFSK